MSVHNYRTCRFSNFTERVGFTYIPSVSVFKIYRACRFYNITERVGFEQYRSCRFYIIPSVSVLYRFQNNTERVGFTYFAERVGFTFQNTERVGFKLQNTERVGFTFWPSVSVCQMPSDYLCNHEHRSILQTIKIVKGQIVCVIGTSISIANTMSRVRFVRTKRTVDDRENDDERF